VYKYFYYYYYYYYYLYGLLLDILPVQPVDMWRRHQNVYFCIAQSGRWTLLSL